MLCMSCRFQGETATVESETFTLLTQLSLEAIECTAMGTSVCAASVYQTAATHSPQAAHADLCPHRPLSGQRLRQNLLPADVAAPPGT